MTINKTPAQTADGQYQRALERKLRELERRLENVESKLKAEQKRR